MITVIWACLSLLLVPDSCRVLRAGRAGQGARAPAQRRDQPRWTSCTTRLAVTTAAGPGPLAPNDNVIRTRGAAARSVTRRQPRGVPQQAPPTLRAAPGRSRAGQVSGPKRQRQPGRCRVR